MKDNPIISVIVPVFNVEKYLPECLNSIINQTFKNIEIIVINDASSDNSLEIIKEFQKKDDRIILHNQTSNQGAAIARNKGIELAKGKYIEFLDSDDYFEKDLLEKMLNKIEEFNAEIAVCSAKKIDNYGNITERKNPNSPINTYLTPLNKPFSWSDFKDNFFSMLTPVPWNKLYLKSLITKNNICFPNLRICEDVAFCHCASVCAKKIIVFDDELINYRYNRPESHASFRGNFSIDVVKSCLELKEFLIEKKLYKQLEKAYFETLKNHIRWESGICNKEQNKNFLKEIKTYLNDELNDFIKTLEKDFVTFEDISKFIGDKKVFLWGASVYIRDILEFAPRIPNILGIIDKNEAIQNTLISGYKVFSPEILKTVQPDGILLTVWHNHELIYPLLKKELKEKYPNILLLDNIFLKK